MEKDKVHHKHPHDKPYHWEKVRLGTRTYFFNLVQASAKNLYILDFSGKIHLGEVGIKVGRVGTELIKSAKIDDPFDVNKVIEYLIVGRTELLGDIAKSFATKEETDTFNLRKRFYSYIVSNESNIVDLTLEGLNTAIKAVPPGGVYQNFFNMDVGKVIEHFNEISDHIKKGLEGRGKAKDEIVEEMKLMLIGLKASLAMTHENKETFLLKRGYCDLLLKYPFMDRNSDPKLFRELKRAQAFPNEIIDSYIYLGNGRHVE